MDLTKWLNGLSSAASLIFNVGQKSWILFATIPVFGSVLVVWLLRKALKFFGLLRG